MTDINPPVQRNWRRRGLLPKVEGWARLSPQDLLHVSLREAMGQLGIPHLDPLIYLDDAVVAAQAWAVTHPGSLGYLDGLEPELHPRSSFFDPPRFRYAWARTPWREGLKLELATDLSSLNEVLAEYDEEPAAGIALIDLKAIGLGLAERAGEPLWYVSAGPGMRNKVDAQNAAANGDKAAQQALEAIGVEWDASKL
ncbi:hypothetical protein GCM10017620_01640 [Brevundimonas intermedia]|uniref:Uncharacterized protein n=1 Tax=Brevundimonas intermedia TaxID=74315 RepID=A0ABQ5T498_9CAUL|nr:hypothetical protein [Brevundimonas intermedia]GLK47191.1 hypothetical protein GCM10017620_01640 [Brevundimonas intermedia]